ncbi:hypothetical protein MHBO_001524 [Bonamia ostreae]|uniref:guanylate kinase n=1 Tax=Bonamia ostreae TaxID=126728 RepID=A0ABV2AJU2_9EUKA
MKYVICGPSGVGKGTLIKNFLARSKNFSLSVSHTTRKMRKGEENGVDYFFVDKDNFLNMVRQKQFFEWEEIHGNYYGTSLSCLHNHPKENLILEIDINGALSIKKHFLGKDLTFIFITTDLKELERRIRNRGEDDEKSIMTRIETAKKELAIFESTAEINLFDHVINSKNFEQSYRDFADILSQNKIKFK